MENISLYNKLIKLPEHLQSEVSDFIDFLINKTKKEKPNSSPPKAIFGSAKGMFKMHPDFDDSLEDFKDYIN